MIGNGKGRILPLLLTVMLIPTTCILLYCVSLRLDCKCGGYIGASKL